MAAFEHGQTQHAAAPTNGECRCCSPVYRQTVDGELIAAKPHRDDLSTEWYSFVTKLLAKIDR